MLPLHFSKYEAAGNDFVVIEAPSFAESIDKESVRKICSRRFGVGSDGIVLLLPSERGDVRMKMYNCDGSNPPFCGNAVRCAALHLKRLGRKDGGCRVETESGLIACTFENDLVTTRLPPPEILHWDLRLEGESFNGPIYAVDTGVPHAVLLTDDLEACDLATLGKAVRFHPFWGPSGVNVTVVQKVSSEEAVRIRTYERGVEAETPSCGSGAAAAAFVTSVNRGAFKPLRTIPPSGQTLLCSFDEGAEGPLSVAGPARFVFQGSMDV